jgi:Tfp pilus assembly protein PilP
MKWSPIVFLTSLIVFAGIVIFSFSSISFSSTTDFQEKGTDSYAEIFSPSVFKYRDEGRRDPFVPLIKKDEKGQKAESKAEKPEVQEMVTGSSEYSLIGLVWDKEGAFAIIRGESENWIVREGDVINDFMISRIEGEKGEVILMGKDQMVRLTIRG